VLVVGLVSFAAPSLGCTAIARFLLHWSPASRWLAGTALSTTSMAVVYAVVLETGFNKTEFGKGILAACSMSAAHKSRCRDWTRQLGDVTA
jgi:glutathione-regulated potassium-efflux system ancillary protein KefC